MAKRSRNWLLTNNYKEERPLSNDDLLKYIQEINGLVYTAFQLEQGEQGTKHHQLYISFKNAKSFDTMKKLFPKAHIESVQGTPQQASEYCTKSDTRIGEPVIYGTLPVKGKRTDMVEIYNMVENGITDREIRETYPSQYTMYRTKIHAIRQELLEEKYNTIYRNLNVVYLCDNPGVGKTRYIMEKYGYENVYRISNYKNPFDTYKNEKVIVFEEFRDSMSIKEMLIFLEGYPTKLPARYSDKVACYEKVYIVSNWQYEDQYSYIKKVDYKTWEAFDRRINFKGNLEQVKNYDFVQESDDCPF